MRAKPRSSGAPDLPRQVVTHDAGGRFRPFALTPYQSRLWKGTRETGVTAWFYQETRRAPLDSGRLEHAMRVLIARHDMLRSVMLPSGEQVVLEHVPEFHLPVHDLSHLTNSQQALALQQIRARFCEPNALHDWPPFAVAVSNSSAAVQHIHLGFNLHLFDLASVELLAADWRAVYEGEPDKLKKLEIGFRDLVRAEETLEELPEAALSAEYWKTRIPQLPPPLDLRSENEQGPERQYRQGRDVLPAAAWRQVKKRASDHHLSASMVVFAVAAGLLARAARRDRFVLESRIFRRLPLHRNQHDVVGQFVAGIPSHIDLREAPTFVERVKRLEETTWRDLDHGYVDAARQWLAVNGAAPSAPRVVFTSTIARFENFVALGDEPPLRWLGEPLHFHYQTPDLGLELLLVECRGTLETFWFYDASALPLHLPGNLRAAYVRTLEVLAADDTLWSTPEAFDELGSREFGGLGNGAA